MWRTLGSSARSGVKTRRFRQTLGMSGGQTEVHDLRSATKNISFY